METEIGTFDEVTQEREDLQEENYPSTEVLPMAKRRIFTNSYKKKIVEMAEQAKEPGEIESLLRREGLYSSHLCNWRKAYSAGELESREGFTPKSELFAENARLKKELAQAQTVIEVQKKLYDLLGMSTNQTS